MLGALADFEPRFPPELERMIFRYALQNEVTDLSNLFLVAERVHEWLAPEAFKVVVLSERRPSGCRVTLPRFKRYGTYIQFLLIDYDLRPTTITGTSSCLQDTYTLINDCISCCPNLTRLALLYRSSIGHLESIMNRSTTIPLTHLMFSPQHLYSGFDILLSSNPKSLLVTTPFRLFERITHLDLIGTPFTFSNRQVQSTALSLQFPVVTHLAIAIVDALDTTSLKLLLKSFRGLRILVLWLAGLRLSVMEDRKLPAGMDDDLRIVCLTCDRRRNWEDGVRGKKDMWELAEEVVSRRVEEARKARESSDE